jgi:VIT1/CCC1 family predicted Fe2+/Mn2+ transporter
MGEAAAYRWSPSDIREVEANYRDEVSSRWVYLELAKTDGQPKRAQMFRELAAYEERHAGLWAGLLTTLGHRPPEVSPMWEHRVLARMARILGVGSVMSLLHRQEVDGVERYRDQQRRWTDPAAQAVLAKLIPDEVTHEIETFNTARAENGGGGSLRSILLGAIDGFASIVALSAGVAGITGSTHTVLIAGSASLVAGAISMAASEYVSTKAEAEAVAAQGRMEREAMEAAPDTKRRQLTEAFVDKGLTEEEADHVVDRISRRPDRFLASLLAERLGISTEAEENPGRQGLLTGISFALAGSLPMIPYLFLSAHWAVLLSVLLTGGALFFAGLFRALSSLQPFLKSGLEMVLIGMGSAGATYLIGLAIGGAVGG